jgi:hypothetical protein
MGPDDGKSMPDLRLDRWPLITGSYDAVALYRAEQISRKSADKFKTGWRRTSRLSSGAMLDILRPSPESVCERACAAGQNGGAKRSICASFNYKP